MSDQVKTPVALEIAHVLFLDIVSYSKRSTKEQNLAIARLNELVQECEQFQTAEKSERLLKIPTGDGMALVFHSSPEEPVRCAVELSQALKKDSNLQVRMGVHSGSISGVVDVSGRANVAGAGINIAQRVMDCGDNGHILLSKHAADDLAEYEYWKPFLHELGPCEVKHGVKVQLASLWNDQVGNSKLPSKLREQWRRRTQRRFIYAGAVVALLGIATAAFLFWRSRENAKSMTAHRSVAVLPFENLSTNPDNAIFAGGVHREVLTGLAKVADLRVISRTSVMRYKPGTERNLKQIADELSVSYVVEGSVQREADHVRVTAELIKISTDSQVWADTYDGEVADVLRIQGEIAERISNQLGVKLSPRERTELTTQPTQDLGAYENYIRAKALLEAASFEGSDERVRDYNKQGVQLLEQALVRDPRFVAAYCALSEANIQLYRRSLNQQREYRDRAEAALKEAQRLAPEAGETLYAQARLRYYGYLDFKGALAILEKAAKLLPNSAEITLTRALLYRRFGRWQEAYEQFVRTTELNPEDPFAYFNGAMAAWYLRWWNENDRMRERALKHFPRFERPARVMRADILRLRGEIEAARRLAESVHPKVNLHQDEDDGFLLLFNTALWNRDYKEARQILDDAAKYPELEMLRWQGEAKLAMLSHELVDVRGAQEAEGQTAQRLKRASSPEDENLTKTLASIELALGKKEEAIRLLEDYVKKHPASEDAIQNLDALRYLADTYAIAGEQERALKAYAGLVHVPGGIWYGPLKYDPILDDLRKDPRWEEILKQAKEPFPRL